MDQRRMRWSLGATALVAGLCWGCEEEATAPNTASAAGDGANSAGTLGGDAVGAAGSAMAMPQAGPVAGSAGSSAAPVATPGALAIAGAVPPATMPATGTAGMVKIAAGTFAPLPGYEALAASGYAVITRGGSGATVSLQVAGLLPTTSYPAHVHALPCAVGSAGGHYKIDPTVEDTVAENEIWPAFETDEKGAGAARLTTEHLIREDGMSVVVHDPAADNAKMFCADLRYAGGTSRTSEGEVFPFAAAGSDDQNLIGAAMLTATDASTSVMVGVSGLQPEAQYISHVHALPCAVNDAGGHYKIDPSVMDTVEANELWVPIASDMFGASEMTVDFMHGVRPDAQSVVLHRMEGEISLKVACADLTFPPGMDLVTSGASMLLPAAMTAGLQLSGTAYMSRLTNGETRVQLSLAAAAPSTSYAVHVHDRPCAVDAGGGHYKHDPAVAEVVEANEVWLPVTTDASGAGYSEVLVPQVLPAEAQALVVHSAEGDRLLCVDLTTAL